MGYQSNIRYIDRISGTYDDVKSDFDLLSRCEFCLTRPEHGVVEKAFSSRSACFCKDISNLSITVCPSVEFARKHQLSGCFAICLKGTQSDHFYILEFFLPLVE